jgi:hypothetical protein
LKGIVFSEFYEMVEDKFSPELLDEVIEESNLPSGGAYTSVGSYDHNEMVTMVVKLSEKTGIAIPDLLHTFGEYLAGRFAVLFPVFFESAGNVFNFMKSLDQHIHVEVKKLYPDADLPKFDFDDSDPDRLVMIYRSERGFAELALGLMNGAISHYGENITVEKENIDGDTHVRFYLNKIS